MQWYYAIDGQRCGPVSEAEFARLIAVGTITGETLVWRQGLAAWAPWSTLSATTVLPAVSGDPSIPLIPAAAGAEAGETDAAAGTPTTEQAADWTVDEFSERLVANGFATSVGGCLSRAWDSVRNPYFTSIAVAALGFVISVAAGMVPVLGMLSSVLVSPHITAGLQWYFLQKARGRAVGFETLFEGFSQRYGKLALLGLLQFVVTLIVIGVLLGVMVGVGISLADLQAGKPPHIEGRGALLFGLTSCVVSLVALFLAIRFSLAHIAAMDRGDGVIEAYRLSWRITGQRFWTVLGLMIVMILLSLAGFLALLIGFIFVLPLLSAMLARCYEDACASAVGSPAE